MKAMDSTESDAREESRIEYEGKKGRHACLKVLVKILTITLIIMEVSAVALTVMDLLKDVKSEKKVGSSQDQTEDDIKLPTTSQIGKLPIGNISAIIHKNQQTTHKYEIKINPWISAVNETVGLAICIICNVLVIIGINNKRPHLMIPWLIVYLIGIISLIIGGLLILLLGNQNSIGGIIPVFAGLLFLIVWLLYRKVFYILKIDGTERAHMYSMELETIPQTCDTV